MKNINDKKSLNNLLEKSNLQFFSSGVLNVNDPFFITHWNISKEYFKSEVKYSTLKNDCFQIPLQDNKIPDSWNHFGFNQSFLTDDYLNAPYHRNKHIELHYVVSGTFNLKVNQTMITLAAGDVCIINPHCYHSDIIGPNFENLELYIVGINEDALRGMKSKKIQHPIFNNAFNKHNNKSEYVIMRDVPAIESVILYFNDKIKSLNFNQDVTKHLDRLYAYDYTLYEEIETSRNTMLFEEIKNFIDRNYRTITLEDLEFFFNFSKDHISRIIKEGSGYTFSKYVQKVRVDKAKQMLVNTTLTIKEIIVRVGYKNETHFYRLFKQHVGLNPNEYRQGL